MSFAQAERIGGQDRRSASAHVGRISEA